MSNNDSLVYTFCFWLLAMAAMYAGMSVLEPIVRSIRAGECFLRFFVRNLFCCWTTLKIRSGVLAS